VTFEQFMEILYGVDSVLIVGALFVAILVCNEIAYRYGLRRSHNATDSVKSQTTAIQAAILGLLALLLGFSFSMGLQRFDSRSEAVIQEANAIGTAYLRTELVRDPDGAVLRQLLKEYLDLRIEAGHVDLTQAATRRTLNDRTTQLQARLWRRASVAAENDPRPVTTGLFVQSLNEAIDAYGVRQAALEKHIPEIVLFLMFAVFAIAGAILGFSSGLDGTRPTFATLSMTALIVLVVLLVIDLDRPRRGLIRVDQGSLIELQAAMRSRVFEPSAAPLPR
jgi:hypothetical protein